MEQTIYENDMQHRMAMMEKKLDRIIIYLFGDDENTQNMGALSKIADLEKRILKLEQTKITLYGVIIGVSMVAGWGISDMIKAIFKIA